MCVVLCVIVCIRERGREGGEGREGEGRRGERRGDGGREGERERERERERISLPFLPPRAAAMTLRTVLLSIQALLQAAEPDDPQDAVVAR